MIHRRPAVVSEGISTVGVALGILLAVIVLVGTWFLMTGGAGDPSIVVHDTDNAVPTVDARAPSLPVAA